MASRLRPPPATTSSRVERLVERAMAFAVEVDTSAGSNIDTVGILEEDGVGGW
jgi:hypothetical protein